MSGEDKPGSVAAGRALAQRRLPSRAEVNTSTAVDRGRAMRAAARGDRDAAAALAAWHAADDGNDAA